MAETEFSMDTNTALDSASEIERLAKEMNSSFDEFVETQEALVAGGVRTHFGEDFVNKLKNYRENEMTDTVATLNLASNNIENAVHEMYRYSEEER